MTSDRRRRIVIMGAAGRDFHNFNVAYRDDAEVEVVAFTAAQIPDIAGRRYPASLAGPRYPAGIAIEDEGDLEVIVAREAIDEVVFAYSDVTHEAVMHRASRALAAGADFALLGPRRTMIESARPVVAVSAVRTGCGKSQTARYLAAKLRGAGLRVAALRHPMPYGDLAAQAVQRFASRADLDAAETTLEEREEYEPYVERGAVVFAGVDYARILESAEREADLILWDGGNNDFPFVRPDLHIVLTDALRPGHESAYHPGETCLRMADIAVIAKSNAAEIEAVQALERTIRGIAPKAAIVRAGSAVSLDDDAAVRGKRVLVVEDGPTITHGGMATGAGFAAARAAGVREIVDPRAAAVGSIAETFRAFPHIGPVLPAMGYGEAQRRDLASTIERSGAEIVIAGTPIDLAGNLGLKIPVVRARYDYADAGDPALWPLVAQFLERRGVRSGA